MSLSMVPDVLNPDIRTLTDTSIDTSTKTRTKQLMVFRPQSTADGLERHLQEVFEQEAPGIDNAYVTNSALPTMAWRLVHALSNHNRPVFGINDVLDTVWDMCAHVIKDQAIYIVGREKKMELTTRQSNIFKEQMERIKNTLDSLIPFVDAQETSDAEIRNMILEIRKTNLGLNETQQIRSDMKAVVRNLSRHKTLCKSSLAKDDGKRVYTERARDTMFIEPVRDAVAYLLEPYMVFKYVATFVPGPWNMGTWANEIRPSFLDMRYAELAIYRMFMQDIITPVRMNLIAHPSALLNSRLQNLSENERASGSVQILLEPEDSSGFKTVYRNGHRVHVYETPGSYSVKVTREGPVDFLIVGGGGGGGDASSGDAGGGGGGGAVVVKSDISVPLDETIDIVVGSGGSSAQKGSDSSVSFNGTDFTAPGGGRGGKGDADGGDGGSGGGGGMGGGSPGATVLRDSDGNPIDNSHGNDGGEPASSGQTAGGGGGAAEEGQEDGTGGTGRPVAFLGEAEKLYGSGGSGGKTENASKKNGKSGLDNTGNGGNGGSVVDGDNGSGGNGGSGVVVIRYDDGTGGGTVINSLENLGAVVISTLNHQYIAQDRQRIPRFHHSIALISNGTRHVSVHLEEMEEQLQQRKHNLRAILENHEFLKKLQKRDRVRYIVALVILILLICTYLALLLMMGLVDFESPKYSQRIAYTIYGLALSVFIVVAILWFFRTVTERSVAMFM